MAAVSPRTRKAFKQSFEPIGSESYYFECTQQRICETVLGVHATLDALSFANSFSVREFRKIPASPASLEDLIRIPLFPLCIVCYLMLGCKYPGCVNCMHVDITLVINNGMHTIHDDESASYILAITASRSLLQSLVKMKLIEQYLGLPCDVQQNPHMEKEGNYEKKTSDAALQ